MFSFNDTKIFLWILLDNFGAVPDVSADGYDVTYIVYFRLKRAAL